MLLILRWTRGPLVALFGILQNYPFCPFLASYGWHSKKIGLVCDLSIFMSGSVRSGIYLLSRLQPFSSSGYTKDMARKNAKYLLSIVLHFCQVTCSDFSNPQHGIKMGPPSLREGQILMQVCFFLICLILQCLWYFSS